MHDRTTGFLFDGLLAGLGDRNSDDRTGLADLGIRVRTQVGTLVTVARELCDACADLADALRPPPQNGMEDPLTMDLERQRAERSAALLDEAAATARGTYRLLEGSYSAFDAPTEQTPIPADTGRAGTAPADPTQAGTAPGGATAWREPPPAPVPAPMPTALPLTGFDRAGFETAPPFELPRPGPSSTGVGPAPGGLPPGPVETPVTPAAGTDWSVPVPIDAVARSAVPTGHIPTTPATADLGQTDLGRPAAPPATGRTDGPERLGSPPAPEPSAARWETMPASRTRRAGPAEPGVPQAEMAGAEQFETTEPATLTLGWESPPETAADRRPGTAESRAWSPYSPAPAAWPETPGYPEPGYPEPGYRAPGYRAPGAARHEAGVPEPADAAALALGWTVPPETATDGEVGTTQPTAEHRLGLAGLPAATEWTPGHAAGPGSGLPRYSELPQPELPQSELPQSELPPPELPQPELPRYSELPRYPAPDGFDPAARLSPPAKVDPAETTVPPGPAISPEPPVVPGPAQPPERFEPAAWEPVAAEFWDDAMAATGAGAVDDDIQIAAISTPRDSTWPEAFVELPRRRLAAEPTEAVEPTMPDESTLLGESTPAAAAEHEDGRAESSRPSRHGAHRTPGTGSHFSPSLTVVPGSGEPAAARSGEYGQAGLAVLARQVEAARRHLQAAVLVAHDTARHPRLDGLLGAVEQVLAAVTELAQESRETLFADVADRSFPGEARFLCPVPWEKTPTVAADPHGTDHASPSGLARLLVALGYDAQPVTASTGVAGVQVRTDRYAAHIALVEPSIGGRQRWSGALEWTDAEGTNRTWAETLGPIELDDAELARRVDDLLRRCVGPLV